MTKVNIALVVSVVALVIAGLLYFGGVKPSSMFGSVACDQTTCLAGGLRVTTGALESDGTFQAGASGSSITQLLKGNCALIGTDASQVGTSTAAYDCAVTGVVSGDTVIAQLATTTSFIAARNWAITGAKASTTAGYITVMLTNLGQTSVPSVIGVGSTTSYIVIR